MTGFVAPKVARAALDPFAHPVEGRTNGIEGATGQARRAIRQRRLHRHEGLPARGQAFVPDPALVRRDAGLPVLLIAFPGHIGGVVVLSVVRALAPVGHRPSHDLMAVGVAVVVEVVLLSHLRIRGAGSEAVRQGATTHGRPCRQVAGAVQHPRHAVAVALRF